MKVKYHSRLPFSRYLYRATVARHDYGGHWRLTTRNTVSQALWHYCRVSPPLIF